jgi:hypothetical protein
MNSSYHEGIPQTKYAINLSGTESGCSIYKVMSSGCGRENTLQSKYVNLFAEQQNQQIPQIVTQR